MNGKRSHAARFVILTGLVCLLAAGGLPEGADAQTKPEGEMRWALYVTLSPLWLDPGETAGQLTPSWSAPLEEVRLKK